MMEINVEQKKEQPLLQREEILGSIAFEGATPSTAKITEELAKKLKVDPPRIVLGKVQTIFGYSRVRFIAHVYATEEGKLKYQTIPSHLKKKTETPTAEAK